MPMLDRRPASSNGRTRSAVRQISAGSFLIDISRLGSESARNDFRRRSEFCRPSILAANLPKQRPAMPRAGVFDSGSASSCLI